MKILSAILLASLSYSAFSAEYFHVTCYLPLPSTQGAHVTYSGTLLGTAKKSGDRIEVLGRPVVYETVSNPALKSPCAPATEMDSEYYVGANRNEEVYRLDFETVEVVCASGSPLIKYGSLTNFKAAMEASNKKSERYYRQRNHESVKGYDCVDVSQLEKETL